MTGCPRKTRSFRFAENNHNVYNVFKEEITQESYNNLQTQSALDKTTGKRVREYVTCTRSGMPKLKPKSSKSGRRLKAAGSKKIGANCPFYMSAGETTSGKVQVEIFRRHVHCDSETGLDLANERAHARIADQTKEKIKGLLSVKVEPMNIRSQINEEIHASGSGDKLVTLCDINNQKKSFSPNYGKAETVDSLKFFLETNDIRGYVQAAEMNDLENPYLFISTDGLLAYLKQHGPECVMIDGTHGITQYKDVKLTTLVVRSPGCEAVPVAFLVSRQTTTRIYKKFIDEIVERTGFIATNIFMADMEERFYNAWIETGNTVDQKRVCVWHVHKAWTTNQKKLKDQTRAKYIVQKFKDLTYVLDVAQFKRQFTNLIAQLKSKESSKTFGSYMEKEYGYNGNHPPQQWALCYVDNGGPKTNMQLENYHGYFKNYIIGKYVNIRYDTLVERLILYIKTSRDRLMLKGDRQPFSHRRNAVHNTHEEAVQYASVKEIIEIEGEDQYEAPFGNDDCGGSHKLVFKPENCPWPRSCLKCLDCSGVCSHLVTCSCNDFRVEKDCEHKHALIIQFPGLLEHIPKITSSDVEQEIMELMNMCPIAASIEIELSNDGDVLANTACDLHSEDDEGDAADNEGASNNGNASSVEASDSRSRLKAKLAQLASQADSMYDDECDELLSKIQSVTEPIQSQSSRPRVAPNRKAPKQTYYPKKQ